MSSLDLASLAFRAEDDAATLIQEDADGEGRLPDGLQARYTHLVRLSDVLSLMARHAGD